MADVKISALPTLTTGFTPTVDYVPVVHNGITQKVSLTNLVSATGASNGSVTTVSVATANGFSGSVANASTTPAITINATPVGILKSNGTALSAATSGTDYTTPTGAENLSSKTITSSTLNSTPIGGSSASSAVFTTLIASGQVSLGGTTGAESFRAVVVASAVNRVSAFGGTTGSAPSLYADGSDTNINFNHSLKGSGSHVFYTGSTSVFQVTIDHTASATNYLKLTGSATGSPVTISTGGTDTNRDLAFTPAGTGLIRFGTHTALGAETVTGYITIKDSGGTTRKIAVVS